MNLIKKLLASKLAIACFALVLILGGVGIGTAVYLNQPDVVAPRAVANVFSEIMEREEIEPLVDLFRGGSVEFSAKDFKRENGEKIESMLPISGKLYLSNDALMLENFNATVLDKKLAADLYFSNELFYIKEQNALGGAYGAEISELLEEFDNSIFAYGSGSDYALSKRETNELRAYLECLQEENNADLQEDIEELFKKYYKEFWSVLAEEAELESKTDTVRIGGERDEYRVITFEMDSDAITAIVNRLLEYFYNDSEIEDFIEKYEATLDGMLLAADGKYSSIFELYEELCEELEDLDYEYDDEDITLKLVTHKHSATLLQISLESDGQETGIRFDSEGAEASQTMTFFIDDWEIEYRIEKKNGNTTISLVEKESNADYDIFVLKFKDNGKFTFTFDDDFVIQGTWEKDRKSTTLTIDKFSETSYTGRTSVYTMDITFVIRQSDRMPSAPKEYQSISSFDEENIEDIMYFFGDDNLSGTYLSEDGKATFTFDDGDFSYSSGSVTMKGSYKIKGERTDLKVQLRVDTQIVDEKITELQEPYYIGSEEGVKFVEGDGYIVCDSTKYILFK